jgi:hypothetical protein
MIENETEITEPENPYASDLDVNIGTLNEIYALVSSIPVDLKDATKRHAALNKIRYLKGSLRILSEKIRKDFYA